MKPALAALAACMCLIFTGLARADEQTIEFVGKDGPGVGKTVVLVAGDEEYRSEEALPQLAKILSTQHGFKTIVVFPIDPKTGEISPNVNNNIPGLEALDKADLMIIATRFRNLPDDQMKHIADFVDAGKPIIGLRTATHAFAIDGNSKFKSFSHNNKGGFGKNILGETWVNHHGGHGSQATRGIIAEGAKDSPILRGIKNGDIFGPTDVYTVTLPFRADCQPLVMGEVVQGMKFDDPAVKGKLNEPMMPVAWTKTYKSESGKEGRVFTTTMGAATDLEAAGTRRLLVNAVYWTVGLEDKIPAEGTKVDIVGEFKPSGFGFNKGLKGKKPADYK